MLPCRPQVLAEVNTQLRSLQAEAQAAASASAPSALAMYNVTELLINATRLGWVAQSSLYNRVVAVRAGAGTGTGLQAAWQHCAVTVYNLDVAGVHPP